MTPAQATATVAVALLLTAAACSGTGSGVVYNSNFTAGYDPRSLTTLMSRAPLLVETYGTPGDEQAQEGVSRATALALRQYGSPWLPRNYTDSPVDAGNGRYRLRIAYGMPKSFDRQRICTAAMDNTALQAARRETDAGSTRTVASLCRGERTLGIAEGSPGGSVAVGGDSFARFVGLLGREALPRQNPVFDDDCTVRFCD